MSECISLKYNNIMFSGVNNIDCFEDNKVYNPKASHLSLNFHKEQYTIVKTEC